ncbi:hypothetical protein NDU88_007271 [Pleurodeles waltl]|uniref:Uncharacterized protein n=1 Tax=Pleurodeles waltl TaxID=8319 RepID=A0AAV7NSL4_PLEWA|nr:hypothetical protein NDU88_007271 [Pleurodeles waltl]
MADRNGALLGYTPREVSVKSLPSHLGGHSDPGGRRPPGPRMTEAPPTGWRCFLAHSDRGGKAAVRKTGPAVSHRFTPGWADPPGQRCKQRCLGDSDPLPSSLFLAVFTARKRLAGTGVLGPLGASALPMPLAWAVQGSPNRAQGGFSLSA